MVPDVVVVVISRGILGSLVYLLGGGKRSLEVLWSDFSASICF